MKENGTCIDNLDASLNTKLFLVPVPRGMLEFIPETHHEFFVPVDDDSHVALRDIATWIGGRDRPLSETQVSLRDAGWVYIVKHFLSCEVMLNLHDPSSGYAMRPDGSFWRNSAVFLKFEQKGESNVALARKQLLGTLFAGSYDWFPQGSDSIVCIASTADVIEVFRATYMPKEDDTLSEFESRTLGSFDVSSVSDRIDFLLLLLKVVRWAASIMGPRRLGHLKDGVEVVTSNGHIVCWTKEGLWKTLQIDDKAALRTVMSRIEMVYAARLPHVEYGEVRGDNVILIKRVGMPLLEVLQARQTGLVTATRAAEQIRQGGAELAGLGRAHCDLKLSNIFVDSAGVFLDDLEYLTPLNDPAPSVRYGRDRLPCTARELSDRQLQLTLQKLGAGAVAPMSDPSPTRTSE